MNLLKRLTDKKKSEKIENYFDFYLNPQISNLKNLISKLSTLRRRDQKKLREDISRLIIDQLKEISFLYSAFLYDLKKLKVDSVLNNETIFLMEEKKKALRHDFESLYTNFKSTAMNVEDIPMKAILKKMRETFDFNNEKQHQTFEIIQKNYINKNNSSDVAI